jgi:tRNA(Ile)-lysidine synthetase-like protein
VSARFAPTLAAAESGALDAWSDASPESAVALVLVLDQFSRHVHRHAPDRDARVAAADARAVLVTERCVSRGWDRVVPAPHQVFLLMPYRHTQRSVARLREAMRALDERVDADAKRADLIAKFRRTTLRCLQDLEGKQHVEGDEILERHEFDPDPDVAATMPDHPVYVTVERFLRAKFLGEAMDDAREGMRRPRKGKQSRNAGRGRGRGGAGQAAARGDSGTGAGAGAGADDAPDAADAVQADETTADAKRSLPFPSVGISLSGGVDSMVLAAILRRLSDDFGGFAVVAMHIDYGNRPESGAEADFVRGWCERRGIVCVVRRVEEVKRGVTPREEYEAESRAIRYGFYKECAAKHGFPAVFVGHHQGDVQENVIANLMRGTNLLAVNGMNEEGIVEGVRVWRPMLPHPKAPVLDFAHAYGVPYFLDTTPKWSTRGKLRNQLVPLLEDMFGEGVLRNLSSVGEDSAQLGRIFETSAMRPFDERVRMSDAGAYVDLEGFEDQPMLFWKEAMKRVCHGLGSGMMTEKSVRELIDRVTTHSMRRKLRDGWITLKKRNKTFVVGKTLAMFASEFFPPGPGPTARTRAGAVVPLGAAVGAWGDPLVLGPWTITAREVADDGREGPGFVARRVRAGPLDAWAILRNETTYHVPAAGELRVDPDAKVPAFRGVDPVIVRAIPVVTVVGLGGGDDGDDGNDGNDGNDGAKGGDGVGEYRVKRWPARFDSAATCVEVRLVFTRTKTHVQAEA